MKNLCHCHTIVHHDPWATILSTDSITVSLVLILDDHHHAAQMLNAFPTPLNKVFI